MPRLPNPSYMQFPPPAGITRGPQGAATGTLFPATGPLQFSGFATPSTIANTAADTLFTQFTMPGGTVSKLGAVMRIRGGFIFSTTGTPALSLRCWLGGLLGLKLFDRGVAATENNCSNVAIIVDVQVRWDSGAAAAANFGYLGGFIIIAAKAGGSTATYVQAQVTAPTGNVDLTAPLTVGFSAQWGAGDPANTITEETLAVEVLFPALAG